MSKKKKLVTGRVERRNQVLIAVLFSKLNSGISFQILFIDNNVLNMNYNLIFVARSITVLLDIAIDGLSATYELNVF